MHKDVVASAHPREAKAESLHQVNEIAKRTFLKDP
jgi:hypothetical protein